MRAHLESRAHWLMDKEDRSDSEQVELMAMLTGSAHSSIEDQTEDVREWTGRWVARHGEQPEPTLSARCPHPDRRS